MKNMFFSPGILNTCTSSSLHPQLTKLLQRHLQLPLYTSPVCNTWVFWYHEWHAALWSEGNISNTPGYATQALRNYVISWIIIDSQTTDLISYISCCSIIWSNSYLFLLFGIWRFSVLKFISSHRAGACVQFTHSGCNNLYLINRSLFK